jgi:hypothetical protein
MMLHQDGSRHVWIEGRPPMDLIVTLDDATSEIYSMILLEEEGTASTFRALSEVICGARPVLRTLHGPRRPLFPHPEGRRAGLEDAQDAGRPRPGAARHRAHRLLLAPGQGPLGARLPHPAGSPAQGTARLAGIEDVAAANRWLREHYIGEYNKTFAIAPEQEGTAFVQDRTEAWREILCVIEERTVGNDNTIAWAKQRLQLPESRLRPHFVKARVHVHEYPDNSVSVFLGPHRLASYDGHGALLSSPTASSLAPCSTASRDGLHSAERVDGSAPRPPLTRSARAAPPSAQVGTKKRLPGRTKKLIRLAAAQTAMS